MWLIKPSANTALKILSKEQFEGIPKLALSSNYISILTTVGRAGSEKMKVWERKGGRRRDKKESDGGRRGTSLASHGVAAGGRNTVAPTQHTQENVKNKLYTESKP